MKKKLTLQVTEEDGHLIADMDAEGFSSLEIIGVIEKVKHSYLYDQKAKDQKQGNNSDGF